MNSKAEHEGRTDGLVTARQISGMEWSLLALALGVHYGLCSRMDMYEGLVTGGLTGLLALWFAWRRQAAIVLMLLFPSLSQAVLPAVWMVLGRGVAQGWPWDKLVPGVIGVVIIVSFRPLRERMRWLRPGRLDGKVLAWVAAIAVVSATALVIWFVLALRGHAPFAVAGLSGTRVVLMAAMFAVLNAALEEIPFRGILQPALEELGAAPGLAIGIQGAAFGLVHFNGFPSGVSGCVLAGLYGVMLGMLRRYAGGMLAPVLAHIAADATIISILMYWAR